MFLSDVHMNAITALEKPPGAGVSEAGKEGKVLGPQGLGCVGKRREDELVFPHHGKGRAFLVLWRSPQLFRLPWSIPLSQRNPN